MKKAASENFACCFFGEEREWKKVVQNGQTEPSEAWVTRRRTTSKQSRHRFRFAIVAKHTLNALLFLFPKKHGLLFGVPESRKTFGERSKRATSLSFRKLKPKRALRRGEAKAGS